MKFSLYLKDRIPQIVTGAVSFIVILIFLIAFSNSVYEMILILTVFLLMGTVMTLLDYNRKKNFYTSLLQNTSGLDKKYLVSETLPEPDFYEGKITYSALCDAGKAMCEEVTAHRNSFENFKEYIELWVHEIKLPVASLILMSHNDGEAGAGYQADLKRIDDYIENVLYYARSENSEKDYLINRASLKRIFNETAQKNRDALLSCGVSLNVDIDDIPVYTDSKWLEYILGQLMGNSMKYFSKDREPEIRLWTEETENSVILHYRDNGIGIPASDLPYIFEKSFTGENGRLGAKSTGMGLYIVKTLMDRLGHRIKAESRKGEYTEFILEFGKNDYYKSVTD
ncbi:MAG: sensor histidine kinase [Lachnospiraceae bacterium]|nr:sensor histidine kinase [Lachnospiraceae bacterium]